MEGVILAVDEPEETCTRYIAGQALMGQMMGEFTKVYTIFTCYENFVCMFVEHM
jgi:hypothetical protein